MAEARKLIVGLGNVGARYANTRHNAGFMAIEALAEALGAGAWREAKKYLWARAGDMVLVKPTTLMNLSGEAVLALVKKYKLSPEQVVVIHDDLDLKLGTWRAKKGGGNAGHNGLKSIDAAIGPEYRRVRLGISHPREENPRMEVADWVLGRLSAPERELLDSAIREALKGL